MNASKPILIIHQGALGDLIMSLPALYSMRLFHGSTPWNMAGNPETLALLHRRFYAQEVVSIHRKDWAGLFQEKSKVPDRFRDFLSSFQKAYLFSANKPEVLIQGLFSAGLAKTVWIPSFPDVQQNSSLQSLQKEILKFENIPWVESEKIIFPSPEDLQKGLEYLRQIPKPGEGLPLWAMHSGSGSPHKNWPLEGFLEVAQELRSLKKAQPFFLMGPVEQETSPETVKMIEARGFPIIRSVTLPVLAGVLSQCAGYLGNDSGVSHLAAALGLPTVVLFGPTDPIFWGPKGKKVRILSPSIPCAPCIPETRRVCLHKGCLASLTARQVLETIDTVQGSRFKVQG
ncbi:MAG: glycosyltransferase family 9 protein [Deltaproteobacteria bacterium]|nr:glycosyltransferase family 9 protein [Deltaproteobacteria bacterium]